MTFHDNDVTNHVTVNCHIAKGHRHLDCNSANVQIAAATHTGAHHTTSNAIHSFPPAPCQGNVSPRNCIVQNNLLAQCRTPKRLKKHPVGITEMYIYVK